MKSHQGNTKYNHNEIPANNHWCSHSANTEIKGKKKISSAVEDVEQQKFSSTWKCKLGTTYWHIYFASFY